MTESNELASNYNSNKRNLDMKKHGILAGFAVLALGGLLAACTSTEGNSNEPPPPAPKYTLVQRLATGEVLKTYNNVSTYSWSNGACIYFKLASDPSNINWRVICGNGGFVEVNPTE
jgi:hypothetical protein